MLWRGFFLIGPESRWGLHDAFALGALAGEFTGPAHGLGALAGLLLGRLLEVLTGLHFPEQTFALHLFLQRAQGLFNIVIADNDLYYGTSPSGSAGRRPPMNSLISGLTAQEAAPISWRKAFGQALFAGNRHTMTEPPSLLLRRRWLDALLPEVAGQGWSETAAEMAAREAGLSEGEQALAAPGGVLDLIEAFFDDAELRAQAILAGEDMSGLRVPDKVKRGVLAWLKALEPHHEPVRRAASRGFLPWGAGPALQRTWKVADMIWTAAGDTSQDYNRFSKRGLLAGVLPAIVLYWVDRPAPEDLDAFITRRLAHASGLGRGAGQVLKPLLDRLPQKP